MEKTNKGLDQRKNNKHSVKHVINLKKHCIRKITANSPKFNNTKN